MVPSSDRDKDPDGSETKTENPFIRFRQFADSQISSILQGIVGLPSAFSKDRSKNTRWADFDDKLQRRDELNEHSKQSNRPRSLEGNRSWVDDEGVEIPVRKFPAWEQYSASNTDEVPSDQKVDGMTTRDLPLYSPVSTSLFAHLNELYDETRGQVPRGPRTSSSTKMVSSPNETCLDSMRSLQYMTFTQLRAGSSLQSNYSLLPYLLFSPYSPLRLSSQPTSTSNQRSNFPYCDAFEDLIRISQGRPMATVWTRVGLSKPWLFHHPAPYAASCMEWIRGIQSNGILQEFTGPTKLQTTTPSDGAGLLETAISSSPFSQLQRENASEGNQCPGGSTLEGATDNETEQDMYEHFLRVMSSPTGPGGIMESLLADIEKEFQDEFKAIKQAPSLFPATEKKIKELKSSGERLSAMDILSELEKVILSLSPQEARRAAEHLLADTDKVFTATLTPEGRRDLKAAWRDELQPKATSSSIKVAPESVDPDKVISTSTTTKYTKNEDGSVETVVTVWKRFADGSEKMTTSTHTEDALPDEAHSKNDGQETKEDEKKQEKRGWFWK
jgi:hypothetical protein